MRNFILYVILLVCVTARAAIFNVCEYGAVGDGLTDCTQAINDAIVEASESHNGFVYLPAGRYMSYSIHLKSNITLYLDADAELIAARPGQQAGYDAAEPNDNNPYQDFGHSHWHNSLLWADGEHDIAICGQGLINGGGLSREESRLAGVGNKAIALRRCTNVTLSDFAMLHCGHFALLATGVDNLTINNLRVDTNRDGFDIDACRNVLISNCLVNTPWDDAIVLKSSYALREYRDCEYVTIFNCHVTGYDVGTMLNGTYRAELPEAPDHGGRCGRIKIGTETSGSFRHIVITDCTFDRCRGIAIEAVDGGIVEDVVVNNIAMSNIVNAPVFLRLGARQRSPEGREIGQMKNITLRNVKVTSADSRYACIISGIPGHKIENVKIENVSIAFAGGYRMKDAVELPDENVAVYPEPWMFGTIPAKGFYIRHASRVELSDVIFTYCREDERPLFNGYDADVAVDGVPVVLER